MKPNTEKYHTWGESELVTAAQRGNDQAFAELFDRHRVYSFNLALSMLRNPHDAEDEVQTAVWKAYTHLKTFQQDSLFSSWLSRIVINQCLMRMRSAKTNRTFSIDDSVGRTGALELRDVRRNPEAGLANAEMEALVRAEIRKIPPLLRDVIELKDIEQRSAYEVAEHLGISVAAVKSRLLRARRELRARMEQHTGRRGLGTLVADA